jgi:hypothetical protein
VVNDLLDGVEEGLRTLPLRLIEMGERRGQRVCAA